MTGSMQRHGSRLYLIDRLDQARLWARLRSPLLAGSGYDGAMTTRVLLLFLGLLMSCARSTPPAQPEPAREKLANTEDRVSTPSRANAEPVEPANTIEPALAREAAQLYTVRCSACHGPFGDGRGPAAVDVQLSMADFTDAAWQAQVTDEQLAEIILRGGASAGKSPMMPSQPDLADRPELIQALVAITRGFGTGKTLADWQTGSADAPTE